VNRIIAWAIFFVLAGFAGAGQAAPPAAPSLKGLWQSLDKKCGVLAAQDGFHEFTFDKVNPQEGKHCVASVGSDVVMFGPNEKGALLDLPRQYLAVPIERIVLQIRQ
jgi:hypothetical protein